MYVLLAHAWRAWNRLGTGDAASSVTVGGSLAFTAAHSASPSPSPCAHQAGSTSSLHVHTVARLLTPLSVRLERDQDKRERPRLP